MENKQENLKRRTSQWESSSLTQGILSSLTHINSCSLPFLWGSPDSCSCWIFLGWSWAVSESWGLPKGVNLSKSVSCLSELAGTWGTMKYDWVCKVDFLKELKELKRKAQKKHLPGTRNTNGKNSHSIANGKNDLKKEEAEINLDTSGHWRVKFSVFSQWLAEVQDHSLETW